MHMSLTKKKRLMYIIILSHWELGTSLNITIGYLIQKHKLIDIIFPRWFNHLF